MMHIRSTVVLVDLYMNLDAFFALFGDGLSLNLDLGECGCMSARMHDWFTTFLSRVSLLMCAHVCLQTMRMRLSVPAGAC